MTEQLEELVADIKTALAKGHKGYTIRGEQMDWVVQALRTVIEMRTASIKRPIGPLVETPYAQS
jgi:hypothetical protein